MRTLLRFTSLTVFALLASGLVYAAENEEMTDQQFDRLLTIFLEDPLHDRSKDIARVLLIYTIQTPNAAVMLRKTEMNWVGKREDDRGMLLFAAYAAGNTRSQLLSGVRQNDRYSGLVTLFSVYRRCQEKDKDFKIAAIDELRGLHTDGKLMAHLVEMEKTSPTKMTAEDAKAIQELLKKK